MGLLRMAARTAVVAGTATAVSGRVAHRQAVKYDQQAQQQYDQQQAEYAQQQAAYQAQQAAAAQAAPPAAAAPAEDPTVTKLKELSSLHDQGVLSDDEFAAAKAKLLGI